VVLGKEVDPEGHSESNRKKGVTRHTGRVQNDCCRIRATRRVSRWRVKVLFCYVFRKQLVESGCRINIEYMPMFSCACQSRDSECLNDLVRAHEERTSSSLLQKMRNGNWTISRRDQKRNPSGREYARVKCVIGDGVCEGFQTRCDGGRYSYTCLSLQVFP